MKTIRLNNGIQMPVIGYGTWDIRGKECIQCVKDAILNGYRLIDTARMYENEIEVGKGIESSGIAREELFLTTKLDSHCNGYELAKNAIMDSLQRLHVDSIDLVLIHEPYDHFLDMYKALEEAYDKGIVRAIGVSNFNQRKMEQLFKECRILPAVNQIESHVFYPQKEFVAYLNSKSVVAQAWSPLAQGQENIFEKDILLEIGKKYHKTAAQIALKYLLQMHITIIPKTSKVSRMKENRDLFDFTLTNQEMEQISKLNKNHTLYYWTEEWK